MKRLRKKHPYDNGWKSNPNAVMVDRSTKWGNPFTVEEYGRKKCLELYHEWLCEKLVEDEHFLDELKGKDLVCWCPLDKDCHADILIEFIEHPTIGSFNND